MGLKVGDEFEIKLGCKHIRLIQIDEATEAELSRRAIAQAIAN
jgi:AbrB-like transcriptional regulator